MSTGLQENTVRLLVAEQEVPAPHKVTLYLQSTFTLPQHYLIFSILSLLVTYVTFLWTG